MKSVKRFSASLLSIIMAFSLISVSAEDAEVKIIKEVTPQTMDWSAEEVAYIDFSEIDSISLEDGAAGHGIKLLPNGGATSWKAANRLSEDGYLLFGKEANTDGGDPEKLDFGNVYFNLDIPISEKANTAYALKVDYYGGGIGVDAGSYIVFTYKNSSSDEYSTPKYTYGSTYNSGKIESMYALLSDANLSENVGPCKGDIRMNTYSGAQLKIRRISVVEYKPLGAPELKEVRKGEQTEIAYIDFSELPDGVIEGPVTGSGLSLLTNESTGTSRGSNLAEDGYVLLGKEARQNDNPEDMESKPKVNGAIYIKLDKPIEEKAGKAYAVKIDYYGGGRLTVNSGSYIDVRYSNAESNDKLNSPRKTFGNTYNSGKIETMYILLPDADLGEKIGVCKGDFRLETWTGGTGCQLKIRRVSVTEYDPADEDINAELLFSEYSEGPIAEETALINADTGEYTGLSYQSSVPAVKVIDKNSSEHFAVMPAYDAGANNLGTFGVKISDALVKKTENAELTVYYWDLGTGTFHVEYNTADNAYTRTETVNLGNTGELMSYTFSLENTAFEGKQTGGYDFKLLTYQTDFCIDKVVLKAVSDEPVIESGDINGDLNIDGTDLAMLRKHLMGAGTFENTDVNCDGSTDIRDLINLKKLIAGII